MRRLLGLAAAALVFMASAAIADEISGAVENLDKTASTFVVGGKPFALSADASGDVTIDDLKDGDHRSRSNMCKTRVASPTTS